MKKLFLILLSGCILMLGLTSSTVPKSAANRTPKTTQKTTHQQSSYKTTKQTDRTTKQQKHHYKKQQKLHRPKDDRKKAANAITGIIFSGIAFGFLLFSILSMKAVFAIFGLIFAIIGTVLSATGIDSSQHTLAMIGTIVGGLLILTALVLALAIPIVNWWNNNPPILFNW